MNHPHFGLIAPVKITGHSGNTVYGWSGYVEGCGFDRQYCAVRYFGIRPDRLLVRLNTPSKSSNLDGDIITANFVSSEFPSTLPLRSSETLLYGVFTEEMKKATGAQNIPRLKHIRHFYDAGFVCLLMYLTSENGYPTAYSLMSNGSISREEKSLGGSMRRYARRVEGEALRIALVDESLFIDDVIDTLAESNLRLLRMEPVKPLTKVPS
ncbi:hypothetical protein C4573_07180 [Candidatus Woesearchaeota archaeon]|nr:MAG: hypothetical protein C4573_07180 [Candidatus Woesearchaeota archaeon]